MKFIEYIYIVDDNINICNTLKYLFESVHFNVITYTNAHTFLSNYDNNDLGCIIIDVRMPVMSGLELLEELNLRKNRMPVIMMTGYGDVPMVIRAMKLGAADFVTKPFNDQCILEIVQKFIKKPVVNHELFELRERYNRLSARERQIIDLIVEGKLNKEIAYELTIYASRMKFRNHPLKITCNFN